uniref:class I SAM-dependent methyltransferase n=1 Tax=Synechococcus sp. UW106 TaxID=368495 RepID=UPI000E0EC14A|nr:class I SAM-dependent methyltransferase [Synechococcus sp. UW106]
MEHDNLLKLDPYDYDKTIFNERVRRLYGTSDLYNYGYWFGLDTGTSLEQASYKLVELHIDATSMHSNKSSIVDVGCGLGESTYLISKNFPFSKTIGINYSKRQIYYAQSKYRSASNLTFICADAINMPIPSTSINVVNAIESAMHFRSRASFLAEAHRILVKDGLLILTDIIGHSPSSFIPRENLIHDYHEYANQFQLFGFNIVSDYSIYESTVLPFVSFLENNSFKPYAREISKVVADYRFTVLSKL